MTGTLTAAHLRELGRAEGGGDTLALLTADQHTRRLLLLRLLFDAVGSVPAPLARDHADLLEHAERAAPDAARRVLFYPLTGPWAESCVRQLERGGVSSDAERDLAHLGSVAAAAAIHAGLDFAARAPLRDGRMTLPTLGALHSDAPDGSLADISGHDGLLIMRTPGEPALEVRRGPDGAWRSDDRRWLPLRTLEGGPRPVLLDDLDPGPLSDGTAAPGGAHTRRELPPGERERWAELWRGALPLLHLGGAARSAELALLDCIVPMAEPDSEAGHSSGTSPGAFGAVLASPPPSPALLAAGLTHELQHAKLAALSDLTPLHTAGPERHHWAPWRPDPRPFDGLLHGAYAHLALAAFWQRLALSLADPAERDYSWAAHARCWTQVAAVLPVLRETHRLTDAGREFVRAMAERHQQLRHPRPPDGHLVRAAAYVATARTLWSRQHARPAGGPPARGPGEVT